MNTHNELIITIITKTKNETAQLINPFFFSHNSDNITIIIIPEGNNASFNAQKLSKPSHIFPEPGQNKIKITLPKLPDYSCMFRNCSLTKIESDNFDVSQCENLSKMFYGCYSLTNIDSLRNWDVGNCIDFSGMFERCLALKNVDALKEWDVRKGENFWNLFNNC